MTMLYACDGPGKDATGCKTSTPAEGKAKTIPRGWTCVLEERANITVMLDLCGECAKARRGAKR